jgi:protein phosphatase
MIYSSKSHVGLVKKENQDSLGHLITDLGTLFIVCDGVSGLPNGALASQTALESILLGYSESSSGSLEIKLKDAMLNGQKSVMRANPKPMGTTAAVCFINEDVAYISWCGDSRIYHFRDGNILWMSQDHNVLHDILNKGLDQSRTFMSPNILNRFFGRKFEVKVDYHSFRIESEDKILICTDGLSDFLSEQDLIYAVTRNSPQVGSDLMETKLLSDEIGAPDNFTWYILQI